ncbi:M23 family metallopeptidase [Paraburkholderia kururiensis]|uniref:M23 family metallopeptidase n=1 Tax=Paraburkholderia kururiensis TaxID=984307 RepID=A0ABZ0WRH5_9BURK|nr:M23 family metallopeptidase [Paraburkholderia kururiensis]
MIISPPFLPASGLTSTDASKPDPMMDAVDRFELAHGIYPVAADRTWHCGAHLAPDVHGPVHAIADGEVVAYRVCQHAMDDGNGNAGFVLLRHATETGDGRALTFYSLYMHLLPLAEYHTFGHDATRLPAFLHKPSGPDTQGKVTPAAKGNGQKVRRKDVLGFLGRYQGVPYMHFEIFTTPGDFDAYFGHTQLGVTSPATATTSDCWGHTCFTIPAGQQFYALPQGTDAHGKLHGIAFKAGYAGTNALPLAVEMYFSKGAKYTNVWSIAADGSRTLLTSAPVEEKDYEYDLYHRATALYEACPSDGYEMLRFGRILSMPATLPEAARATWVQIPYDTGKRGYIDISRAEVKKLSDADFPSFMGWQKISDGNTPFVSDGLCDVDLLKKLVRDAAASEQPTVVKEATEVQKADALSYYVKGHEEVRRALRGFICNAPSEWDSTHNETRFAKLLDEGGFYHGNRKGYEDFLKYLKELQFWDVTGLPAGEKLWFFHPLAFIRHFRKCGWIGTQELRQLMPAHAWLTQAGALYTPASTVLTSTQVVDRISPHLSNLNKTIRKYSINSSSERLAIFLAQTYLETDRWKTFKEYGLGTANPNIPAAQYYAAFYGRGIMQLTWASQYEAYGKFSARSDNYGAYVDLRITQASLHYWDDPRKKDSHGHIAIAGTPRHWAPYYDPDVLSANSLAACDSGGFFWIWKHHDGARHIGRVADLGISPETIHRVNVLVNGGFFGYFERFAFTWYVRDIFTDWLPSAMKISVTTPRHATVVVDLSRPV